MRKYLLHVLIISFVVLVPTIIHSAEEEKDRLLVVPLKPQKGIDQEEANILTDILSVEIIRSNLFTVLNRDDMKAILSEKEFELAMGCGEDNICLLENVAKLSVNKVIAGSIGLLGKKYIVSIKLINKDGQTERMLKESCSCPIEDLEKTIETISYRFLKNIGGKVVQKSPETIRQEPSYGGTSITKLRSSYKTLSVSQVHSMPNVSMRKRDEYGFSGHSVINHNYNFKTIGGDKVIVDNATGLMWHQGGSRKYMKWKKAKKWIKKLNEGSWLNKSSYAGYHDWRLPTLEEAASLLESNKRNDLYIDPVFSNKQKWIWTGDSEDGSEAAWIVYFHNGHVLCSIFDNRYYVRPVRSVE
jgi:hypothetical protein